MGIVSGTPVGNGVRMSIYLPQGHYEAAVKACNDKDLTMSGFIQSLIEHEYNVIPSTIIVGGKRYRLIGDGE